MQVDTEMQGNICILRAKERRLDARLAVEFKKSVAGIVESGNHQLLFDMSGVDFMDSSGLGALVACLKLVSGKGDLQLCELAPSVLSLVKLTRLDRVFRIHGKLADGLLSYA